jgi:Zn-dependent peptidase ImmA (M78 family)
MIFNYIEEKSLKILNEFDLLKYPINVNKLAKKLGVGVEASNFNDEVSGLFVIKDDKPFIAYNLNQNKKRRRFTIAHELGHYILHSKSKSLFIDKNKSVMYRNSESSTGEILKEREANAFAAALLMPIPLIASEIKNLKGDDIVEELAKKFNVSTQAMSFRLSNLGYDFGMF